MQLLIPLAIFIILVFAMIVTLSHVKPPDPIDTVESFCDAVMRNDETTKRILTKPDSISHEVCSVIMSITKKHTEVAQTYGAVITRTWDDAHASYALVDVPILETLEALHFTCRRTAQQWTIISMSAESDNEKV